MKMIQKIGVGLVCLSLIFTLGCKDKKASASPSNAKTATAQKQGTASPSAKSTGAASATGSATGTPAATAATTAKPGKTGPFDGGFKSEDPLLLNLFSADNAEPMAASGKTPISLDTPESTLGGQFFATTSFSFIETACPSWDNNVGNLTLSIYNWNTDYATTVAGKAIKSQEFVDYKDNQWLQLSFETPLPAGEYLWVLSNPVEKVGIWDIGTGPEGHEGDVRSYVDGEVIDTFHIARINYTKTPNITLEKLS